MKLQLDTKAKVIRLDESINLGELQELLEKILPNDWKNYKLEPSIVQWSNPIIIERHYPRRAYPWWSVSDHTTIGGSYSHQPKLKEGVYCLQTNE